MGNTRSQYLLFLIVENLLNFLKRIFSSPADTTLFLYNNSGMQWFRSATNQIGYVKGNGNGNINIKSDSEAASQKLAALLKEVYGEGRVGDGTRTQPSTALPGENHHPRQFINTGEQTIIGLTNQTGIIEGDNNGAVNI
ncbi:hypothetical protein L6164_026163 [Bauhinia variegata]|uniref:Uncharacterized protein n=1 Tax=Bauhinia variegata TaxID=167791 RepID=A0ACB9LQT2_BAUVA|nr:hypothetical protein L6164_026163 [Bauhinia variegata]